MSTCPEGHQSTSDDYCDVCGSPIDDTASPAPSAATPQAPPTPQAPAAAAEPAGVPCPNCQSENVPDALFCEACGYDFTTGTMPRPWVNPFADTTDTAEPSDMGDPGDPPADPVDTTPAEPAEPAEDEQELDTPSTSPAEQADPDNTPVEPADAAEDEQQNDSPSTPLAEQQVPDPTPAEPVATPDEVQGIDPLPTPLDGHGDDQLDDHVEDQDDADDFAWVAELWVDPDWYRHQDPPDPMPSPGLPEVVPLQKRSVLVGRPSNSRGIHPDIDCDSDPGASRRQAQLTTDGRRWWIEDLDSSNGTYVSGAAEGLPEQPIPVGQRHELDPDDRVYIGAWTRLVIRRATDEERETFSS